MNVTMGVDLLYRRIEEWTEQAMIEPEVSEAEAEALGEYGADFIAFLHDVADELELGQRDMMIQGADASSREVCEELLGIFVDEGASVGIGGSATELRLEGLPDVFEAIAAVLEAPFDDATEELEEATEGLEEFLADSW